VVHPQHYNCAYHSSYNQTDTGMCLLQPSYMYMHGSPFTNRELNPVIKIHATIKAL